MSPHTRSALPMQMASKCGAASSTSRGCPFRCDFCYTSRAYMVNASLVFGLDGDDASDGVGER